MFLRFCLPHVRFPAAFLCSATSPKQPLKEWRKKATDHGRSVSRRTPTPEQPLTRALNDPWWRVVQRTRGPTNHQKTMVFVCENGYVSWVWGPLVGYVVSSLDFNFSAELKDLLQFETNHPIDHDQVFKHPCGLGADKRMILVGS